MYAGRDLLEPPCQAARHPSCAGVTRAFAARPEVSGGALPSRERRARRSCGTRPHPGPTISTKGQETHRRSVRARRMRWGSCWSCLMEGEPPEEEREAKVAAPGPASWAVSRAHIPGWEVTARRQEGPSRHRSGHLRARTPHWEDGTAQGPRCGTPDAELPRFSCRGRDGQRPETWARPGCGSQPAGLWAPMVESGVSEGGNQAGPDPSSKLSTGQH